MLLAHGFLEFVLLVTKPVPYCIGMMARTRKKPLAPNMASLLNDTVSFCFSDLCHHEVRTIHPRRFPVSDQTLAQIPVSEIQLPEQWKQRSIGDPEQHTKFIKTLSESMRTQGLLHPIGVWKDKEGVYRLNWGRHRLEAAKMLGWATIPCTILDAPDELSYFAENLFRKPLDKGEMYQQLNKWRDLYEVQNPESKRGAAGIKAMQEARASSKQDQEEPKQQEKPTETKQNKPFSKVLAEKAGIAERTAQRALRRAKEFTPEEMEIFDRRAVTSYEQDAILGVEKSKRQAVIALVAAGKDVDSAIKEVVNAAKTTVADQEMTDDQWFKHNCGDVAAKMRNPAIYKSAAILYRQIRDARDKFKSATRNTLSRHQSLGFDPFLAAVRRVALVNHPKHWLVCGSCSGSGDKPDQTGRCDDCRGAGYKITMMEPRR